MWSFIGWCHQTSEVCTPFKFSHSRILHTLIPSIPLCQKNFPSSFFHTHLLLLGWCIGLDGCSPSSSGCAAGPTLISTAPARPLLQQQEMLPAMGSRPTHFDICIKCSPPYRHRRFPVHARCGMIVREGNGGQMELRQKREAEYEVSEHICQTSAMQHHRTHSTGSPNRASAGFNTAGP